MRWGKKGDDWFPDCKQRGIAALDYYYKDTGQIKRIVEDCKKLSEDEYEHIWQSRAPENPSGKYSMLRLWKEMKVGDIIYAKTGPEIVGKGTITGEYEYDLDILKDTKAFRWGQFVRVKWENEFVKFKFKFDATPWSTIQELIGPERQRFLDAERASGAKNSDSNM
jgi:hypothetical protein